MQKFCGAIYVKYCEVLRYCGNEGERSTFNSALVYVGRFRIINLYSLKM